MRVKNRLTSSNLSPVLFGDQWPQIPKCPAEPEFEGPGLTEVKKWRLQTLLAVTRWGIPSLAFADAYEKMFGRPLDLRDLGFSSLSDMISNLPDVFVVQEPDDLTALIFPDHPDDRILHDARLSYNFQKDRTISALTEHHTIGRTVSSWKPVSDTEELVFKAYYNRDYEFPRDVVLPGEQYSDFILPKMVAGVPGTKGIYQTVIVGAAHPNGFYINVNNHSLERIDRLGHEVGLHFASCGEPVEMYSVPEEFIYPGFPCLVYQQQDQIWERGQIVSPGKKAHKVLVETVDYGGIVSVDRLFLYLMPRKFLDIPKQAVYVSLIGLKPSNLETQSWSRCAGARVRCFSHSNYWLDILLIEPARYRQDSKSSSEAELLECTNGVANLHVTVEYKPGKYQRRGKKWHKDPEFEALVCDRHDEEMSLHLDEVLTMEGWAAYDGTRTEEINSLRKQFQQVLEKLPRPRNPFTGGRKYLEEESKTEVGDKEELTFKRSQSASALFEILVDHHQQTIIVNQSPDYKKK